MIIQALNKIGETIRTNQEGRIKHHPLIREITLTNGKHKIGNKETPYSCYHINIDTNNSKFEISDQIPLDISRYLNVPFGKNNYRYIIGDYIYVNDGKNKKDTTILNCLKNVKLLSPENETVLRQAEIINENIEKISDIISTIKMGEGLIFNITINGVNFYEIEGVTDYVDEQYFKYITEIDNGNILIKNSFFDFYNTNNKITQTPNFNFIESYKSLTLNEEKLKNLFYSTKALNNFKKIVDDYGIIYLPNYENLSYDVVDGIISKKQNITKALKDKNTLIEDENKPSIDYLLEYGDSNKQNKKDLSFILLFVLKGKNISQLITSINYTSKFHLDLLNEKIENIRKELSSENYKCYLDIQKAFNDFFKIKKNDELKKYSNQITTWVSLFFQGKYKDNPYLDEFFVKKLEDIYINSDESKWSLKTQSKILNDNYKFLKYMENNGKEKFELGLNTKSYKLGFEIGVMSQTWQDGRENLKNNVNKFNGLISKQVNSLRDAFNRYITIKERLDINGLYYDYKNVENINNLYKDFTDKFDKFNFIMGYNSGYHNNYNQGSEQINKQNN